MFAENPDVFLQDMGVTCTKGAYSFKGLFDMPDQTMQMAGVNIISTMYQLTCKTSDVTAAAIVSGVAITVAGGTYVVRDVIQQDDGVFSALSLSK